MRDNTDNMYNHIDINGTDYIDITNVQGQSSFNEPSIHEPDPYSGELPVGSDDPYSDELPDHTLKTPEDVTDDSVEKKINSTRYPNTKKVNTKAIILGSLVCVLLIFILSVLFPSNDNDNTAGDSADSSTEATTEATTEMKTGWQIIDNKKVYIEEDGSVAVNKQVDDFYVGNDGTILTNQWVGDYYVGGDGKILSGTLTPDGTYVGYDGKKDLSMGTVACSEGLNDLRTQLEVMVEGYSGTWSIYVKDLSHAKYLLINNEAQFSASMIKIYCAAEVYDRIATGELEETDSIDRLLRDMISVSDNDAYNLLVRECASNKDAVTGCRNIQQYIINEGYTDTTIATMLVPTKYPFPNSPGRNFTTVKDCGTLMEKVYKKKIGNSELSEKFLELLLNQEHVNKIPSGLPEGIKCANKTGDNDDVQHDAAIVYSPGGDYIIAVMSSNCGSAITNIQDISRVVYEYFN